MRQPFLLFILTVNNLFVNGQASFQPTVKYMKISSAAQRLYGEGNVIKSALTYDTLFTTFKNEGYRNDKYYAACVWALTGNKDKAFFYLQQAITTNEWVNLPNILSDTDLDTLHSDTRWQSLIDKVIERNKIPEAKLDKPLISLLDSIFIEDQRDRQNLSVVENKYGVQSNEIDSLWNKIRHQDEKNLAQVTNIIDTRGWLGPSVIGQHGASTLFYVIQHADSTTQVKYLPVMKAAVKRGEALPQNLALLEDRVLTYQGEMQIYGSQIKEDSARQKSIVPIIDEANVDIRRASVGLGPLEDYAAYFGIKYVLPKKKK